MVPLLRFVVQGVEAAIDRARRARSVERVGARRRRGATHRSLFLHCLQLHVGLSAVPLCWYVRPTYCTCVFSCIRLLFYAYLSAYVRCCICLSFCLLTCLSARLLLSLYECPRLCAFFTACLFACFACSPVCFFHNVFASEVCTRLQHLIFACLFVCLVRWTLPRSFAITSCTFPTTWTSAAERTLFPPISTSWARTSRGGCCCSTRQGRWAREASIGSR